MSMYKLRDRILVSKIDGETVLLDLDSGKYFGLNATASAMLEILVTAESRSTAISRLKERFPQAVKRIESDLEQFIAAMVSRGLLQAQAS